jgi:hypothetical protein
VTNVFGERMWIDPAARSGRSPALTQRWRMFTLEQKNAAAAGDEDLSLLLLPTRQRCKRARR